ncbi:hypothetical protein K431DRAFT_211176, partial [Polychaeton citri CBS 116435]
SAAALLPRDRCCFQLTASGGVSGSVGQLNDGQNRVGGGYSPATYCINGGSIIDNNDRGCILTPPTTQFQCDQGATPTSGFTISSSGQIQYNGSNAFYACPATDSEYNIYTNPVEGQDKCVQITLGSSGKCSGNAGSASFASYIATSTSSASSIQINPPPSSYFTPSLPPLTQSTAVTSSISAGSAPGSSAPQASTYSQLAESLAPQSISSLSSTQSPTLQLSTYSQSAQSPSIPAGTSSQAASANTGTTAAPSSASSILPSETEGSSACQTTLIGAYQTPHLIVPVSSSQPDHAYGTQYNATVNSGTSTIFNFDIPQDYHGRTCSIIFLLPEQSQLETSAYDFSGTGSLTFQELSVPADQQTTYNSLPSSRRQLNSIPIQSGNSYVVTSESCQAGQTESILVGSQGGLKLSFFQDWNPAALGLFITSC